MILNKIKFTNLRSFKESNVSFGKINHITGRNLDQDSNNGTGKTTLLQSVLLLLGGPSLVNINLDKFIREGEQVAEISGVLEIKGDTLEVKRTLKRSGTNSLKIKVNGEEQGLTTSKKYQNLLNEYIGDSDTFKKFRILDNSTGINILDFTSGQLRKTLMSMCQDKFDSIRKKLLEKKARFEKYNKDAVFYKYAPSEKRLFVLEGAIKSLEKEKLASIRNKFAKFQKEKNDLLTQKGKLDQSKEIRTRQIQKLKSLGTCPSCFQKVPEEHKAKIIKELSKGFAEIDSKVKEIIEKIEIYNDILLTEDKKQTTLLRKKDKLNKLKYKLETRIAQKEYKYTDADIELAKKAIETLDDFSNYYICEWIKIIEPLVNNYIDKMNMAIRFLANDKNKIEIQVFRNEKTFTYDMLSQGEKIFISTVFKIALLLERQESGLIIADEAFDCLSIENLNHLIQIISELPIQLIFVTHKEEYHNLNAKTIFIEKKDEKSKVRE